jgi:hypothetical protein
MNTDSVIANNQVNSNIVNEYLKKAQFSLDRKPMSTVASSAPIQVEKEEKLALFNMEKANEALKLKTEESNTKSSVSIAHKDEDNFLIANSQTVADVTDSSNDEDSNSMWMA